MRRSPNSGLVLLQRGIPTQGDDVPQQLHHHKMQIHQSGGHERAEIVRWVLRLQADDDECNDNEKVDNNKHQ